MHRRKHFARVRLDSKIISDQEWQIYKTALQVIQASSVTFLLGGGFAQGVFTGRWRNTKDIDLYVMPKDRKKAIDALLSAGFTDYYERLAYDRKWIFRSYMAECIVDVIWSMANHRAAVDSQWFERSATVRIHDEEIRVVPIEELIWCKLYVLQRDRCDWLDIFNLLHFNAHTIDWGHLLKRVNDDLPLLTGLLNVFCWLSPDPATAVPESLRECLRLPLLSRGRRQSGRIWRERARSLDSRAWFAALDKKLEI